MQLALFGANLDDDGVGLDLETAYAHPSGARGHLALFPRFERPVVDNRQAMSMRSGKPFELQVPGGAGGGLGVGGNHGGVVNAG